MRHLSAGGVGGGAYNSATVASIRPNHPYFTEFTVTKGLLYGVATLYVIGTGVASVLELFLDLPCLNGGPDLGFENPAYDGTQCPHIRHWQLLGLTPEECSFARRLVASILMGGFIGWERRQADRPAGIRTMALVSLGSCLFTIDSTFAFVNGPMNCKCCTASFDGVVVDDDTIMIVRVERIIVRVWFQQTTSSF